MDLNHRPTSGRQHENGNTTIADVLLSAQILVGGDEYIKGGFGGVEKLTIF